MDEAPASRDIARGHTPTRGHLIGEGLAWTARWSLRFLLVVAALTVVGYLVIALWDVMFPVFLGLVIATVLEPPVTWLRNHRWPGTLATAVVLLLGLAVFGGIIAAIAPAVAGQAPAIGQGAVGGIQQIQGWLQGPPFNLGASQIGQYVQAAVERLQQSAGQIATGVLTGLTTVANSVINAVLALVLAFLFVKDGPTFLPWLRRVAGPTSGGHLAEIGARSWLRLGGFIRSQALIGFVDALFIGVGLVIFGVPLALPLAVLTFFGAFIPIIGALVAGALSVLIALVVQGPGTAIGVLILILAVQQIEGNLLQPLVQGRGLGLNSAIVILAVTAGSSLAGIAGAFLAVPVAAVIAEILRYFGEQIDLRTGAQDEPSEDAVAEMQDDDAEFEPEPDTETDSGDSIEPADRPTAADSDGTTPGTATTPRT
ncbi:putative PurR-regulated permease PerM [Actinomycetospora succinea]|uniref:Putative PurR-regulated permease PerM n=1 Tax=Actinomycetospora succinea TaxID=663603 RepID=A0A4R6UNE3_9PSEU|nr:AI-2E family transporter [Actinomycetospora succinea]TDQ47746.1 putative PurR-regulated permease PerM [Actinomycetospora succinea]